MTLARRARLAAGMNPNEFAKLIGTDPATYLSWEAGSKKPGRTASALMRLIEADPEFCSRTLSRTRDASRLTGLVVIVVHDEDTAGALWDVCEVEGFEVLALENGWEAIEYLKRAEEPPCAIVLDVAVPVINGWQLISWLRQQEHLRTVPLITVSADPSHAGTAEGNGAKRHFSKPLDVALVLEEIKSHCKSAA